MADTRRQILLTIREQSQLLSDSVDSNTEQHRWSAQQWWESFVFLFASQSPAGQQQHQDDLLFFVRHKKQSSSSPQVFVRRKGRQLPDDLQLTGKDFGNVDWAQTVLLNLVLHSQYQLTVVACGPEALSFVAEGRTWSPGMISVTRPVYASTTVTAVNLDSSRAKDSNPQPCYPDICFAVDNFEHAFEDLVLEEVTKCYCVVLHAILDLEESADDAPEATDVTQQLTTSMRLDTTTSSAGNKADQQLQQQQQPVDPQQAARGSSTVTGSPAAPQAAEAAPVAAVSGRTSSTDEGSGAWRIGTHKRTLFAGYVSFQQIQTFMDSSTRNGSSGQWLNTWLKGPKPPQKDKVVMTGPGGMGRCEVAVTKLEQPCSSTGPGSSTSSSSSLAAQQTQQRGPAAATCDGPQLPAASEQQQVPAVAVNSEQHKQGLLQRGLQRARVVASGVTQVLDVLSELQPQPSSSHMLCALMTLRLPVHYLAQELLGAI